MTHASQAAARNPVKRVDLSFYCGAFLMKFGVVSMVAACVWAIAGCTSTDVARTEVAKDESCRVTGSNLPKRECRGDVTTLPPSAMERVGSTTPAAGKGN
jgi:hypothetical protein